MTVLIEHHFKHHSAVRMDTCARNHLAENRIAAECVQHARWWKVWRSAYSILISRRALPEALRTRIKCFGGRNLSRIENLAYTHQAGLDQMTWATAASLDDVEKLFDEWKTDRLILKRSDSYKGRGLLMFSRHELDKVRWNPGRDVFCAEVNREDGTVTKVECCGGDLIFTWCMRQLPVREMLVDGLVDRKTYLSSERFADIAVPEDILAKAKYCSVLASRDGLGHISLDFMRSPNGDLKVIEMNSQEVAVWWTAGFATARQNYCRGLYSLVSEF